MAQKNAQRPVVSLFWGNQSLQVTEAADAMMLRLLADAPPDFALHRFDTDELLRPGGGRGSEEAISGFELACYSPPLLCEHYVVRLAGVHKIKVTDRAARNLRQKLSEIFLVALEHEGHEVFALEEDLLPGEEGGRQKSPLWRWVDSVGNAGAGPPVVVPAQMAEPPRFLVKKGAKREVTGLEGLLNRAIKTKFTVAGSQEEDAPPTGSSSGGGASRLHQVLEDVLSRPPQGLHLLLTAEAARETDLSKPLLDAVKAQGGHVEKFVTYDDFNPVEWVRERGGALNLPLGADMARLLIHLAGNDLGRLQAELEKLALMHPGGQGLGEDALYAAIHGGSQGGFFLLTERLGARDLPGALAILRQAEQDNTGGWIMLVGVLARWLRQLLQVHALLQGGLGENALAARLRLPPFVARKVARQAQAYSPRHLERLTRALAELDVGVRRQSRLAPALISAFLEKACAAPPNRRPAGRS